MQIEWGCELASNYPGYAVLNFINGRELCPEQPCKLSGVAN